MGGVIAKAASQCTAVGKDMAGYWNRYGGWKSLVTSPFFLVALSLTAVCTPYWWTRNWWELSATVIPAILGFSIAAFTLLLSLGDDKFKLKFGQIRDGKKASTMTNIATAFFHFIVIQIVALVVAFVGGARLMSEVVLALPGLLEQDWLHAILIVAAKTFRALGFFLLAYSLGAALAASLTIYRLALAYSTHATALLKTRAAQADDGAGSPPTDQPR